MTDAAILEVLQHALGVDRFGRGSMYRDHFVAGPGHSDFDTCLAATERGLMQRYENKHVIGGNVFVVTDQGRQFVLARSPKPDRKQKARDRYSRYLDLADVLPDLTFGDFLRRQKDFQS